MRVILFLTILALSLSTCYAQPRIRDRIQARSSFPRVCIRGRGPGCDDGEDPEPVADRSTGSAMTSSSSTSLPDFGEDYSPRTFSFESFSLSRVPSGENPEEPEEGEVVIIPQMTGGWPFGPPYSSEPEGVFPVPPLLPSLSAVIAG